MHKTALIDVETFMGADDLIRALHPLDKRWGGHPERWIFRGHWRSDWELVPSIYRAECVDPFLDHEDFAEYWSRGAEFMARLEREVLTRAFEEFDNAGLAIPDPMNVRPLLNMPIEDAPGMLIPFMALAQHHGVPTRLLDWTTRAKVAAYFAAAELVKHPDEKNGTMEIIALNTSALDQIDILGNRLCRLWKAPRASNANLHAQAGVFTVCRGLFVNTPLDELLFGDAKTPNPEVFRRLRLPEDQAYWLLQDLKHEGISGATMFPGYDGAVRRMKEERFYWEAIPF